MYSVPYSQQIQSFYYMLIDKCDIIYLLTALGWHPVAVVQHTFTHKQYIAQHNWHKQYIEQHN